MIALLDIETTDLLRKGAAPSDASQPWLVSFAAELATDDGETLALINRRVRLPENTSIKDGAERVHGISTRQARRAGCSQRWAMFGILELLNESSAAYSYGSFDRDVGASLIERIAGNDLESWRRMWNRPGLQWVNVMVPATAACKLASGFDSGSYKFASLDQAGEILCGLPPREGPHSALDDLSRMKAVAMHLRALGYFEAEIAA
jgi:hypothetical protein